MRDEYDTLPPQDLEAEQAVLGACLLGSATAAAQATMRLHPADFYRSAHGLIFKSIAEVLATGQPVDSVTVSARMREAGRLDAVGGLDYIDRLVRTTPYTTNAAAYAETVKAHAGRRALIRAGQQVIEAAQDTDTPLDEVAAASYGAVSEAIREGCVDDETWQTDGDAVETWVRRRSEQATTIPTGFPSLDKALRGGWKRQQVHLLSARTRMGKSVLALMFISRAIDAGVRCGLASLEMPTEECIERLVAMRLGVSYELLEDGPLALGERFPAQSSEAIAEAGIVMRSLVIDEASGYGTADMSRRLQRLRHEGRCGFLVLDHVHRVSGEGRTEQQQLAHVNRELQRIAHPKHLGCPVLVVAQQNRTGEEGGPKMGGVKGCGDFEEHSPVLLLFKRDLKPPPGARYLRGDLLVAKNRGGHDGEQIVLEGDRQTLRWTEVGTAAHADCAPSDRRDLDDRDPFFGED